jgi:phosphonate transport system substrate-binding protein
MLTFKTTGGLLAAGVIALAASAASAQECKNPDQLVFSIIPTEETTQEVDLYKPVIDALRANTGKKIEFFMPTSYASVVEAMINGWVHVGVHGPNSYVIAHEKDPKVEVFATYAKVAGGDGHLQEEGPGYRAVLLSRKDSGLDTIEKLKGKVVGLVEPASTSGDLLPRVVFGKKIGTDLESYFSKVVYTGGHDLATLAVKEGRVDAAFVATHRFDNVVDRDLVKLDELNVLWQSPFIPQDPFTYRTDLCPEILEAIKKTFLTLHETPDAQKFLDNVKSKRFVEVTDADYDIIRELAAAKKK